MPQHCPIKASGLFVARVLHHFQGRAVAAKPGEGAGAAVAEDPV